MTATNTAKDGTGTMYWLLVDSDGRLILSSTGAAHDAAAVGNTTRVGGVYRTSAPAVANGDIVDLFCDAAGRLYITGAAAHDAAALGNPVQVGGVYRATAPAVADGDAVSLLADAAGRVVVKPYESRSVVQLTADGNIKASAGRLYRVTIATVGVTAADTVIIKDDTTERFRWVATGTTENAVIDFGGAAFATSIVLDVSLTGGNVYVTAVYE